jgi:hypothetical protein
MHAIKIIVINSEKNYNFLRYKHAYNCSIVQIDALVSEGTNPTFYWR